MKKYIQPTTQFIALGAERLCQQAPSSITPGDPSQADAPWRNFNGTIQSLKYLI